MVPSLSKGARRSLPKLSSINQSSFPFATSISATLFPTNFSSPASKSAAIKSAQSSNLMLYLSTLAKTSQSTPTNGIPRNIECCQSGGTSTAALSLFPRGEASAVISLSAGAMTPGQHIDHLRCSEGCSMRSLCVSSCSWKKGKLGVQDVSQQPAFQFLPSIGFPSTLREDDTYYFTILTPSPPG